MLNKLRLLVINVRRRTVLFMVCKYIIFFFIYVKVALTDHEIWPRLNNQKTSCLRHPQYMLNVTTIHYCFIRLSEYPRPHLMCALLKGNLLIQTCFNTL